MLRSNGTWLLVALCALLSAGCSDDEANDDGAGGEGGGAGSAGSAGSAGKGGKPQYLMGVSLAGDGDNGSLYLVTRDTLDLNFTVDDFRAENALEFEPYTGFAAIDGHVIVGQSNAPLAKKFAVSDDHQWSQVGGSLHFDDYFESDVDGLNYYFQAIQGTDMFLHYGADRSFRKHWNVRDWTLLEDLENTNLPTRAGWELYSTGNRTGMRDWKGAILQTFNMANVDTGAAADESWIAVYDEETNQEKAVLEIPCPGLAQQTMDEDGNVYVSTTFNTPVLALYGEVPASCVVRIKPDGTQDEAWGNKNLGDFTGGFDGVNFRYLYDGKAVANVLHHDRIEGVDWDGPVDQDVVDVVEGYWVDDVYTDQDFGLWELELIDLETGTSRPITGWNAGHDPGSYMVNYTVDGRVFFKFQLDTYSPKPTDVMYELDLDTAEVTLVAEVEGTLDGLERLR